MENRSLTGGLSFCLLAISAAVAAEPYRPAAPELQQMRTKLAQLGRRLDALGSAGADPALLADAQIYRKAAEWILRYPEEFYTKAYAAHTLAAIERGLERTAALEAGRSPWAQAKGRLSRGYVSRVDGSIQPYGLVIPESYSGRPVRLDVVLHGRGSTLNEVSFLAAHDREDAVPAGQDFIQLEVFGRTNNAYRWSGETDVFEALESVLARYRIDPARIVLRGFSMGGAGAWHLGLHYPDRWAAMEAGAGFTETRRYAKLAGLPAWQEAALHIYDAVDYARNVFNLAAVGYGGEIDPQLRASVNMREAIGAEGFEPGALRVLFLAGPGTAHKWHPESLRQSSEFIARNLPAGGGGSGPAEVRFVTWTLRYNRCRWVEILGLERHYRRARVDAKRDAAGKVTASTENVTRVRFAGGVSAVLDGQPVSGEEFERRSGKWMAAGKDSGIRKRPGLQGPVDDAFTGSFLCVRPTGKPLHAGPAEMASEALERLAREFPKWLRGDARVKDDVDVTAADIAAHHLILFGDPRSNRLLGRMVKRLPLRWTASSLRIGGRDFEASSNLPALIHPNPLNPAKYVVLNSGHTFGEAEFLGTNALLFPRLGDWGVVERGKGIVASGYFDEGWR
jgi:pimeloyl-ACP methyl ester carboxylesterase